MASQPAAAAARKLSRVFSGYWQERGLVAVGCLILPRWAIVWGLDFDGFMFGCVRFGCGEYY